MDKLLSPYGISVSFCYSKYHQTWKNGSLNINIICYSSENLYARTSAFTTPLSFQINFMKQDFSVKDAFISISFTLIHVIYFLSSITHFFASLHFNPFNFFLHQFFVCLCTLKAEYFSFYLCDSDFLTVFSTTSFHFIPPFILLFF